MNNGDLVKCTVDDPTQVGIVVNGGNHTSLVAFGIGPPRWVSHEWLEVLNESR